MDERRMQRRVGWVVLFTLTFLGIMLVINNPAASPFRSGGYEINLDLPNAPGVAVNTPVRKDGVLVGRVSDLDWTDEGVRLKVRIDRDDVLLYPSDKAQVEPSSIFGDAVIKFTRQVRDPGEEPLLAESVVSGTALPDPLSGLTQMQQNLGPSIEKLGEAGEKVAVLADKINTVLGDDIGKQRIQEVMDELMATLQDFRRTTNNFDELLSDNELRGSIADALREFPGLMEDARGTLQQAGKTLEGFDRVIVSAGTNLRNIEGLTAPLGENGAEIAELLISAVDNLDIVLADFSRFAKALNSS
ncbi:MAG: MlaD family protein, partial [Aeoliella sp.]